MLPTSDDALGLGLAGQVLTLLALLVPTYKYGHLKNCVRFFFGQIVPPRMPVN
jgi:hypothetical protein